jgi:sugar (glycoside-pentoside-hexuronide) transporter
MGKNMGKDMVYSMGKRNFETKRLERLSYGGFFLGQNIIYVIQLQFLSYFYTEYLGLTLLDAGVLLFLAKIWDAVNDPIMGAIVDKVNFKKGKYLPWLKFVTYTLPISLLLMFVSYGSHYSVKLLMAYITYIVFDILYTISDAPLFSLSTVMSSSSYERDLLLSYGRFAAAAAAIMSAVFMDIKDNLGWTLTVAVYCVISFITIFPLQFTAKERIKYHRDADITFKKIFLYLIKNKYLLIYYIGYMAIEATNTLQIIAVYFANSNLGDETMLTVIMGVSIVPVIFAAPFLPRMIKALGKRRLTVYSSVAVIIISIAQYYIGYNNLILFLAISALRVALMQIPLMIYGMFIADCIEYGAYINGERTEGMAFALQTFVTKLGGALCNTLCLAILGLFGYVQQSEIQTPLALKGIWVILSLVPIAGFAIMIVVMYFYKLDEKTVAQMTEQNRKKAQ